MREEQVIHMMAHGFGEFESLLGGISSVPLEEARQFRINVLYSGICKWALPNHWER